MARNLEVPGLVHLYSAFAAEAASPEHPSHEYFRSRFERLRARLREEIEGQQARGAARLDLEADSAAVALIALSDGLQLQWLMSSSIDPVAELQRHISTWDPPGPDTA